MTETNRMRRLLWAGFMAILAAGIGFAIRGGILANWAADFGFTGAQLGNIGGAGFTGFCFGIIIGGVDRGQDRIRKAGHRCIPLPCPFRSHHFRCEQRAAAGTRISISFIWGTFIFASRTELWKRLPIRSWPLFFPNNRTHYLNILHASWPAGLVIGGVIGWTLG